MGEKESPGRIFPERRLQTTEAMYVSGKEGVGMCWRARLGQVKAISEEVVLGDMGLRKVRGLEHYLEVPTVNFGFDQQLSVKVFSSRRWKKFCLSGILRLARNAGCVAGPENSGGIEG